MNRSATLGALALVLVLLAVLKPGPAPPPVTLASAATDEVLVRYAGPPDSRQTLFSAVDATGEYNAVLDVWRLELGGDKSVAEALSGLDDDPLVEFAQPNYRYVEADGPTDPLYTGLQHTYYSVINAPAAWEVETGSPNVVVAVLDDGVDTGHPELGGRIWTNNGELAANGLDDDGNGCVDDLHGCNFLTSISEADVDEGEHGTFVAGIIAANSSNGEGVVSMAPGAAVMPVVVLDEPGIGSVDPAVGTTEGLAAGVLYAAQNGADILNMSLALDPTPGGICPTDALVEDALRQAHDLYGATIVASAGNFNIPCVTFPAASQYAVAVSAAGPPAQPDIRAFFSNWGAEVDVAAPGMDLVSTCPDPVVQGEDDLCLDPGYGSGSGTSFSAPIVSGLAALILSAEPGLTNDQVADRLRSTARDLPDDQNPNWDGAGMIDAGAALGAGSAYLTVHGSAASVADLSLSLEAKDGGDDCAVTFWDQPDVAATSLSGSFGVGGCAEAWPPDEHGAWSLAVENGGRKAATLHTWSAAANGETCVTSETPIVVPAGAMRLSDLGCEHAGRVSNDEAANAHAIDSSRLPRRFEQDVRYATTAGDPPPSCVNSASRSVWYRIAFADDAAVVLDTTGSSFDTVLTIFEEAAGALQERYCNDEFVEHQSRIVLRAQAGVPYYVMASAYQTVPAGLLRLNLSQGHIPPNDQRDASALLTLTGEAVTQPAHSATRSADDPPLSCVGSYGASLWFRVEGSGAGDVTVDTTGSDYNTVIGVFTEGGNGALAEAGCNNDVAPGTRTSRLSWQTAPGETYWVVVGAFGNRAGGVLSLSASAD